MSDNVVAIFDIPEVFVTVWQPVQAIDAVLEHTEPVVVVSTFEAVAEINTFTATVKSDPKVVVQRTEVST